MTSAIARTSSVTPRPETSFCSWQTLPYACDLYSCGSWTYPWVSGSRHCSSVTIGVSTSYSTLIFFTARRAVSGWSAATSAIASPWYRILSMARTGWSRISRP